ncbi:Hpt domain-containing protein [Roseibacterium sp. SDUM158016]|uniref:Hpt domain-containing protein n=1 Tax=Roseicyclus sediminis TaxID=2980997 RepID=UPI0021CE158B|nr:Hpt domain-containing protein [Roseibacterium sp. SDUM158016]MCU4652376.1 Hpt domain-containing protein [Roseibacterium sp. SDUM158016]
MSLIDWDVLISLRADIGEEDFADVVFVFVAEMGEKLAALSRTPGSARADDFHFLRGSAANLGFTAMVSACNAAEAACRSGEEPDLDAVEQAFEAALAEARPHLPELDAA